MRTVKKILISSLLIFISFISAHAQCSGDMISSVEENFRWWNEYNKQQGFVHSFKNISNQKIMVAYWYRDKHGMVRQGGPVIILAGNTKDSGLFDYDEPKKVVWEAIEFDAWYTGKCKFSSNQEMSSKL